METNSSNKKKRKLGFMMKKQLVITGKHIFYGVMILYIPFTLLAYIKDTGTCLCWHLTLHSSPYLLDIDNSDTEKEPWFKLEFGKKVETTLKKLMNKEVIIKKAKQSSHCTLCTSTGNCLSSFCHTIRYYEVAAVGRYSSYPCHLSYCNDNWYFWKRTKNKRNRNVAGEQ